MYDVEAAGPAEIRERRLHPAYLLISAGETLRAVIPAVVGISVWRTHWVVPAVAGLVVAALSVARWLTKTYAVSRGVLQVRSGIFARTVHTIPASRITALDAHRGVVQRVFRVWGLKVQTPGDGERATVRLACLSSAALEQLRAALDPPGQVPTGSGSRSDHAAGDISKADTEPAVIVVGRLDARGVLLAAVTGASIPLLFLGAAAAWNRLHDLLPDRALRTVSRELVGGGALIIAAGIVLAVLAGVAIVSLRLARFTVVRVGDRLRISRGLLAQRSGTVAVDRIQAIRIVEGLWRRPLGYCAIELEVAGLSGQRDSERLLFPLLRTAEIPAFIGRALPELHWPVGPLTPIPRRARRRYFTFPLLVGGSAALALLLLPGHWAALATAPLPLAVLLGIGQSRDAAWQHDQESTTLRWRRILARHTVVARTRRVQLTSLRTNPWQRRAGLAGVRIELSSKRKAGVRHLDVVDAMRLLHGVGRRVVLPAVRDHPDGRSAPDPALTASIGPGFLK